MATSVEPASRLLKLGTKSARMASCILIHQDPDCRRVSDNTIIECFAPITDVSDIEFDHEMARPHRAQSSHDQIRRQILPII
ncbi:hypothetical protein C2G38_2236139 [Gigaspora rosea]|uniref:Uncharacterized protein n=1 Tax=Gigaspora rosea TaxID=44941 RepID=A0A397TP77_9GLOM|nr:hypothetical protein C2G38_2236139 [Gigaspora rosea]